MSTKRTRKILAKVDEHIAQIQQIEKSMNVDLADLTMKFHAQRVAEAQKIGTKKKGRK